MPLWSKQQYNVNTRQLSGYNVKLYDLFGHICKTVHFSFKVSENLNKKLKKPFSYLENSFNNTNMTIFKLQNNSEMTFHNVTQNPRNKN